MLGWIADLFRLAGGLFYWNVRKSWFQFRRGRSACPCQSPSDSGRAFETSCEACLHWHKPARFRRVCPLLVDTPDGLRCSVNTAQVRPFWGRLSRYYGGALVGLYGVGVLTVFIFLRTVGYPVSIFEVGLPHLWGRLSQARGWFFFEQSKRAFANGNAPEGLMYLANAYDFDPGNYRIGLTLAKNYQVGQPAHADEVFARLIRDHPDRRSTTAQDWFRALLPRGNFQKIIALARDQVLEDPAQAHVWMRALLFATRQQDDDQPLRDLLANSAPAAATWHRLLQTELQVRAGREAEARRLLTGSWPTPAAGTAAGKFTLVYRVSTLTALRDTFAAMDLLATHQGLDDEARKTLLLDAYAVAGAHTAIEREVDALLAPRLTMANLATVKLLCAQLIRHPDPGLYRRVYDKMERERIALDSDTAGIWCSLLVTAGAVGDLPRLHDLAERLKGVGSTPFLALVVVEAFFRGETSERRITSVLPFLPLPIEVSYALIERYAKPAAPKAIAAPPRK